MRTPSRIEAVDDVPLTARGRFAAVRRGYDEAPWEMWLYAMDLNLFPDHDYSALRRRLEQRGA